MPGKVTVEMDAATRDIAAHLLVTEAQSRRARADELVAEAEALELVVIQLGGSRAGEPLPKRRAEAEPEPGPPADRGAPPEPEPPPDPEPTELSCDKCGDPIEHPDIADLSKIRFKSMNLDQGLCERCFAEAKAAV